MARKIIEKGRGVFDEARAAKYKEVIGEDLTKEALRLIPYVQYCAVNHQQLDRNRMDATERKITNEWVERGWIEKFPYVVVSREFWQFMCDVLFDFYIDELVIEEAETEALFSASASTAPRGTRRRSFSSKSASLMVARASCGATKCQRTRR